MHLFGRYAEFASMDGVQSRWTHTVRDTHQEADEQKQIRPQVIPRESEAQVMRDVRKHRKYLPPDLLDGILDVWGTFLKATFTPG